MPKVLSSGMDRQGVQVLHLWHHEFLVLVDRCYHPLQGWAWVGTSDHTGWTPCVWTQHLQDVSINTHQILNNNWSYMRRTIVYSFHTNCSATPIFIPNSVVYLHPIIEKPFRVVTRLYWVWSWIMFSRLEWQSADYIHGHILRNMQLNSWQDP